MAKRRAFVPGCPSIASLEGRVVLSSIGSWFSSQYSHLKEDLGITHKHNLNAAAGIQQLWNESPTSSKPTHQAHAHAHHLARIK